MTGDAPGGGSDSIAAIMAAIRQEVTAPRDAAVPAAVEEPVTAPEPPPEPAAAIPPPPAAPPVGAPALPPGLDDTVGALLAPMLREWLDAHLPELVEAATRSEIRRLTGLND